MSIISNFFDSKNSINKQIKYIKQCNNASEDDTTMPLFCPILVRHQKDMESSYNMAYRKLFLRDVINNDNMIKIRQLNEHLAKYHEDKNKYISLISFLQNSLNYDVARYIKNFIY